MKAYIRHVRAAGFCVSGAKDWFDRHQIDWRTFIREGADVEVLDATGDELAFQVTRIAREEAGQ